MQRAAAAKAIRRPLGRLLSATPRLGASVSPTLRSSGRLLPVYLAAAVCAWLGGTHTHT
jgi:hypothetical protein